VSRARNVRVGHWLKTRRLALAAAPQVRFARRAPTLFGGGLTPPAVWNLGSPNWILALHLPGGPPNGITLSSRRHEVLRGTADTGFLKARGAEAPSHDSSRLPAPA